jgi:putative salt-induced outer membrane protein YdiY
MATARADEVVLTDGERLIGKVQTLTNGKLTFTSDKAGTVTINASDIGRLTTEAPVRVSLTDRTVVTGRLLGGQDGYLVVDSAVERRAFPLTRVAEIGSGAFRWKGTASVGVTVSQNRLDSRSTALTVTAKRQTNTTNAVLDSAYLFSQDAGVTTEDYAFLNGDYRVGQQGRRSGFINGSLQTDQVQKLDLRLLVGGGYGYQWRTGDSVSFRTDIGLSLRYEAFRGATPDRRFVAQLAYGLGARGHGGLTFGHELAFYPALSATSDSYLRAQFSLEQPLSGAYSLNARAILDETTRPGPNAARYTSKYIFGLGVSF